MHVDTLRGMQLRRGLRPLQHSFGGATLLADIVPV
jgi:hypothetical protein